MVTSNRILVVIADDDLRGAVVNLLRTERFDAIEARDATAGLRSLWETPSGIVILDLVLPDMDGTEFVRRVGHDAPHVRVVAMTPRARYGMPDPATVVTRLGDVRPLRKPFSPEDLLGVVRESIVR